MVVGGSGCGQSMARGARNAVEVPYTSIEVQWKSIQDIWKYTNIRNSKYRGLLVLPIISGTEVRGSIDTCRSTVYTVYLVSMMEVWKSCTLFRVIAGPSTWPVIDHESSQAHGFQINLFFVKTFLVYQL